MNATGKIGKCPACNRGGKVPTRLTLDGYACVVCTNCVKAATTSAAFTAHLRAVVAAHGVKVEGVGA